MRMKMNLDADRIEATLDEVLPCEGERPDALSSAMRYAVCGGGKRIRPKICLAAAVAVGGRAEEALYPAAAVELLHSYTLIHDDLPAMDDDAERRGKPSVWKKFGEAVAVLAGDALQALAYRTAARAPRRAAEIVEALGEAGVGVVRGQADELAGPAPDPADDFVVRHKTADLFVAAAVTGALAGGGSAEDVARLRSFALNLGIAFQHEDDLLDGDGALPRDEAARRVESATADAIAALAGLPGDTEFLSQLATSLKGRTA